MNTTIEIGRVTAVQVGVTKLTLYTMERSDLGKIRERLELAPVEHVDAHEFALELYHLLGQELRCPECGFIPEDDTGTAYCRHCMERLPPQAEHTDEEVR